MKVVVTGGGGKFGHWLVDELCLGGAGAERHDVLVVDRKPAFSSHRIEYVEGNILDVDQLERTFAHADAIIHCAGIPTSGIAPDAVTFSVNACGTFNVHEAARRRKVPCVVTLSSEAVLGWAPGAWIRETAPLFLPIDETHPLRPQDAYGLSKVACEEIAKSFNARTGIRTVCLRPPWIVTPEELQALADSNGVTPRRFALFHYIDARDLAQLCRRVIEAQSLGEHEFYFAGSGETIVAEPLCSLYPRLMPMLGDMAAAITGNAAPVSIGKAKSSFNWAPSYSWRNLTPSARSPG